MKTDDSGCQRGMKHVVIIALCALAAVCPALGDSTDDAESIAAWRRVAEPPPGILPDFGASELARLPLPLQDCARRIEAVRNLQAAAEKGDAQAQRAMAALHGKPETDASAEEVVCPYAPLTFGENEIEAARWQKRAHRDASERLNVEECAREERARDEGWQVSWGEGSDVLDSSSALERDAQDDADARFMLGIVLYVTAGGLEDDTWFMSFAEIVEHGGCRGRERQEGLRQLLEAARAGQQDARRIARLIVETGDVDFALAAGGREAFQEIMLRRIIDTVMRKFAAGEICREEGFPDHWNDCYNRMVEMNWLRLQTHLVPAHLAPNPRKAVEWAREQEKHVRQDVENGEAQGSDVQYVQRLRAKYEQAIVLYDRAKAGDRDAQYELGWNLSADPGRVMRPNEDSGNTRAADDFRKRHDSFAEGMRWLLKAAFAGQVDAQYLLGEEIYRDDDNYLASTAWLLKAALQGHEKARGRLGFKKMEGMQ